MHFAIAGDIFVSENQKTKSNPEFLHLNSEIVVFSGHIHEKVAIDDYAKDGGPGKV